MHTSLRTVLVCITVFALATVMAAQTSDPNSPTWWNKYQQLANAGTAGKAGFMGSKTVGTIADASNECGPRSETYITLNPNQPQTLAAGSNEIFRLPMRGYSSTDRTSAELGFAGFGPRQVAAASEQPFSTPMVGCWKKQ